MINITVSEVKQSGDEKNQPEIFNRSGISLARPFVDSELAISARADLREDEPLRIQLRFWRLLHHEIDKISRSTKYSFATVLYFLTPHVIAEKKLI